MAAQAKTQALVTLPGLGCGLFAGPFKGQLGEKLRQVLLRFLKDHAQRLPHIRAVYYDPYRECANERREIEHISLLVRPLTLGNQQRPQLCPPAAYAAAGDDFSGCRLFSFVAWDHVSWPGNDFYIGSRATDDGVKAAATDSMRALTGVSGTYSRRTYSYNPPPAYTNWADVVQQSGSQLRVVNNLQVVA